MLMMRISGERFSHTSLYQTKASILFVLNWLIFFNRKKGEENSNSYFFPFFWLKETLYLWFADEKRGELVPLCVCSICVDDDEVGRGRRTGQSEPSNPRTRLYFAIVFPLSFHEPRGAQSVCCTFFFSLSLSLSHPRARDTATRTQPSLRGWAHSRSGPTCQARVGPTPPRAHP